MEGEHPQIPENNAPKWQGEITEFERIKRELPWLKDQRYYLDQESIEDRIHHFKLREITLEPSTHH